MTVQVDRATGAVAARWEAERVEAIATRGFTERQARFLVTVMLHSGVFVGRQYAGFAGNSQGQKVHDFIEKLLVRPCPRAGDGTGDATSWPSKPGPE